MEIRKSWRFWGFNWSNGEKFVGEHIDGKANGYGIILDADGYKYVGEFKDKKREGWDYTIPSGSKYIGQWKNGKETGHGIKLYLMEELKKDYMKMELIEK